MKTLATVCSLVLVAGLGTAALVFAGPLAPPGGPVTGTYKTLTEIEPRIPVNAVTCPGDAGSVFIITQPGSYYLTGNVEVGANKDGIKIASSMVKLDLNGYTIAGSATAKNAVILAAGTNTHTIGNGSMTFFSNSGINGVNAQAARVNDLTVTQCGQVGICVGAGSVVQRCETAQMDTGFVLFGDAITISDCTAQSCSASGYQIPRGATATRCAAANCGKGFIIYGDSTVIDCTSKGGSIGFDSSGGATLTGCAVTAASANGFNTNVGDLLVRCHASDNTGNGFTVRGSTLESCVASDNTLVGFVGASSGSTLVRCTANDNAGGGINAFDNSVVRECVVNANNGYGIRMTLMTDVLNNTVKGNNLGASTPGIWCAGAGAQRNQISGNTVTQCDVGIQVDSSRNAIFGNKLSLNTTNFSIAADNRLGTIVTPGTTGGLVSGSSGGVASGTTDPWANFAY
jgi:parallel beta-helix repeat protein